MSTTVISVDQYLHGIWEPDREYVNGEVVERQKREKDHGAWQGALVRLLSGWRQSAGIQVIPELRVRTMAEQYRVPDVVVLDRNAPDEQVITHAPLLCVEILSPEDRITRMEDKIDEYFRMGVRGVWVMDPRRKIGYQCEGASVRDWKAVETLTIPGTPVTLTMQAILADLN
ncbi:MAG: Uma2 family endonuclease [Acidobacteriaceae bacterium]